MLARVSMLSYTIRVLGHGVNHLLSTTHSDSRDGTHHPFPIPPWTDTSPSIKSFDFEIGKRTLFNIWSTNWLQENSEYVVSAATCTECWLQTAGVGWNFGSWQCWNDIYSGCRCTGLEASAVRLILHVMLIIPVGLRLKVEHTSRSFWWLYSSS